MTDNKRKKLIAKNKERSKNANAMLMVCVLIFLVSVYQLYSVYKVYATGNAENMAIKSIALRGEDINTDFYWKYDIDFDALLKLNQDIIGWVRFEEPEIINYVIVQSEDNDYYLRRNLQGEYSSFGTLFMDRYNDSDFSNANSVIYGHNMRNGAMFGGLKKYEDATFYHEYPYFYIYTPDGYASKYEIFAVQEVASDSWHYKKYFSTLLDYAEYLQDVKAGAFYATGVEVPYDANIVTLSTCTAADTERLIVQGVKIEERKIDRSDSTDETSDGEETED